MTKKEILNYLQDMQQKYYEEQKAENTLHWCAITASNRSIEYKEEKQYQKHWNKAKAAEAVVKALDEIVDHVYGGIEDELKEETWAMDLIEKGEGTLKIQL